MLLKNGIEFDLFADQNKAILKEFTAANPNYDNKGHDMIIKYAKRLVKPSKDNPGKEDKPTSITIPFRQSIAVPDKGSDVWIYCQQYEKSVAGVIESRSPWDFQLTGIHTIPWRDVDLAFFFWMSEKCGNGRNPDVLGGIYVIEDKEKEATARIDVSRIISKTQFLILNGTADGGLSDEKIRKYAAAYGIASTHGIMETRTMLNDRVRGDGSVKNYTKFLKLTENHEEVNFLEMVQKAKEAGRLQLKGMKVQAGGLNQQWVILDLEGGVVKSMGHHRKFGQQTDSETPLMKDLERHPEYMTMLIELVEAAEMTEA